MLFNVALALLFILPLDGWRRLLTRLLPERKKPAELSTPLYLDEAALATPPLALANAARETLRMGDIVETMLRDVMTALMTDDRKLVAEVSPHGQCRRQARRGDQAVRHQAHARQPGRARRAAAPWRSSRSPSTSSTSATSSTRI